MFTGAVCTGLTRHWPGVFGAILRAVSKMFFRTPTDGAQSILYCALTDDANTLSGKFVYDCAVRNIQHNNLNKEDLEKLWNLSASIVGLTKDPNYNL